MDKEVSKMGLKVIGIHELQLMLFIVKIYIRKKWCLLLAD